MKFREFINTCQTAWEAVNIYTTDEDWEAMTPERTAHDLRELDSINGGWVFRAYVDAWEVDTNLNIHVLLSR